MEKSEVEIKAQELFKEKVRKFGCVMSMCGCNKILNIK